MLYWEKMEGMWWVQRNNKGSTLDITEEKKKKKGKKGKKDDLEKPQIKISDEVKKKVIRENLASRKKQHRKAYAEYKAAMATYSEEQKANTRDAASKAPKAPVFKLLPPTPAIFALMESALAIEMNNLGKPAA
eukprot:jgi/Hompol1/2455/HPOL_005577-RA